MMTSPAVISQASMCPANHQICNDTKNILESYWNLLFFFLDDFYLACYCVSEAGRVFFSFPTWVFLNF
jgi:hypothetical protein